jgi:TonB family protein
VLDVLIDENGQVENVMVLQSVDQRYDELLMAAARAWRYTPAYKDGRPVKFLKRIQVIVQ